MSLANGKEAGLRFGFELQPKNRDAAQRRRPSAEPFRILLLADLSGRTQRNISDHSDLHARPCPRVDLDEYDSILMKYSPRIEWPIGQVRFKALDDFHPDHLFHQLEIFKALRETRKRLKDPSTFSEAARHLRSEKPKDISPEPSTADVEMEGDVFSRLMGNPSEASKGAQTTQLPDAVSAMIRDIVAPYIVPEPDPRRDQYIASVDMAIADQMRAILHHRDFQMLESTWRGVWDLVTGLELDEHLELYLLDVTKQELYLDLRMHATDLAASGLCRQMGNKASGGLESGFWSAIVGHYEFEYSDPDMALLTGLGILASRVGAPFLSGAHPSLIGCESFAQRPEPSDWESDLPLLSALRKRSFASWIGLFAPRVLMRLPYGEKSEAIDAFPFEELSGVPDHAHFLWGSPALACAKLLGMAFNRKGWSLTLEDCLNLEDLPSYPIQTEYGSELKPCAEIFINERIAEALSRRGFIVLMSFKNRNAVRIRNWQSISDPPVSLSGPWQ